jgi:glycosyltransferase involved in cell wall biosynthesis
MSMNGVSEEYAIDVSVVMPCLNEAQTIGVCVAKAQQALTRIGIPGEVIVADNGSTDGSIEIAEQAGARVVHQKQKGYGNAYLKGIIEARGQYIIMGDSDNTYDFSEIERFLTPLRDGYDVVVGNRFQGMILQGAMPWHHRYIGNPALSSILNLFFQTGISDAHCGLRALTREAFDTLQLQATGMEFASEMVIKAAQAGLRMTEVPITYAPRPDHSTSKLRSFRDGWRHLRFMLLYSPTWLFLIPGFSLVGLGFLLLLTLVWGPIWIAGLFFDFHYMVLGSLFALLGSQVISFGLSAKVYALSQQIEAPHGFLKHFLQWFTLERGLLLGGVVCAAGLLLNVYVLLIWLLFGFHERLYIRETIFAMTLMVIGIQIAFSSFFLSFFGRVSPQICTLVQSIDSNLEEEREVPFPRKA